MLEEGKTRIRRVASRIEVGPKENDSNKHNQVQGQNNLGWSCALMIYRMWSKLGATSTLQQTVKN